jgi:outer membrane protein TolC
MVFKKKEVHWERGIPVLCRFKPQSLCIVLLFIAMALGLAASCASPEQYKKGADEEVYNIIDSKWQERFGYKVNYKLSDAEPNLTEISQMMPENGVLTLRDAVAIATKHSRDYQNQKESLYLAALDLTLTRYEYAWKWLGTIDLEYTRTYNDTTKSEDSATIGSSYSLEKNTLLADGIQISTSLAVDWARFLTGDPQTSLASVLYATVTAPILGAGAGRAALENLTQAERNVLYDIRTFNRYRQTFVTSIVADYYNVLLRKERVNINQASYRRLVQSTNQLRMEVEVGQRPQYDADEAEQSLLSAENNLVSSRQSYEQALDRFKISLALPTDANITLDQNELRALENIGISQPEYTVEEAIDTALENRFDLINTRDQIQDSVRKLELAADGLGPQLNLTASMDTDSPDGTDFTRLQFHESEYSLALDADLPFDRKSERNEYRKALINLQQDKRGYDESVDQIKLSVRQAYRDLAETAESYRIQKIGLELALKRLDREKLLLEYGQGTVRLLLESEDAIVSAQNSVTTALVDHTIAKLNFFRDIGVLRVKPDGMWE